MWEPLRTTYLDLIGPSVLNRAHTFYPAMEKKEEKSEGRIRPVQRGTFVALAWKGYKKI